MVAEKHSAGRQLANLLIGAGLAILAIAVSITLALSLSTFQDVRAIRNDINLLEAVVGASAPISGWTMDCSGTGERIQTVGGVAGAGDSNLTAWILIQPVGYDGCWPVVVEYPGDGAWEAEIVLGILEPSEHDEKYIVRLGLADAAANLYLSGYLEDHRTVSDYPSIAMPAGIEEITWIIATKAAGY